MAPLKHINGSELDVVDCISPHSNQKYQAKYGNFKRNISVAFTYCEGFSFGTSF